MVALTTSVANAGRIQCPAGCFCLNGGTVDDKIDFSNKCNHVPATSTIWQDLSGCFSRFYDNVQIVSNGSCVIQPTAYTRYFADQFSEIYDGYFGFYGFIDNEFVYGYQSPSLYNLQIDNFEIFSCPISHPHSGAGARALTDCFKYDANGNKVHYRLKHQITCNAGTYLPANAPQCANCSALQNHVCPGGAFDRMSKVQGLKIKCYSGQYLPAGAKQCKACDTNNYLCMGGIYDFDEALDQGRIQIDGYVPTGDHEVITCQPGYYIPVGAKQCVACTGDYACPGGVFYSDATYNVARGAILCAYGHANSTHTSCVSQSTQPSYMLAKVASAASQQIQDKVQQKQSGTNVQQRMSTNNVQLTTNEVQTDSVPDQQKQLDTMKRMISMGMIAPATRVQNVQYTQPVATEQQEQPAMTEQQKQIESMKRMISAGLIVSPK